MQSVVDLVKDRSELSEIKNYAVDVAVSEGVVFRVADDGEQKDLFRHAPFMLFPSPIPRYSI